MTVHFYAKEPIERPASRQRAFLVAEELRTYGIDAVVHSPPVETISETPWPRKGTLILEILRSLPSIKKDDVVFLQRTVGNKYFFAIMVIYLRVFRRKMIFDFDDAIYRHSFLKTVILTRMASAVIVCSRHLEAWARRYNKNVHVIHTSLKFAEYAAYTRDYAGEEGPCVIGWIGTAVHHLDNLEFLARVFALLLERNISFKFLLVGAVHSEQIYTLFRRVQSLDVEFVDELDWTDRSSIPRAIQRFDVGVMPLVNRGEWNLARSSFKMFEYMACGVASISSDVGEITHVIKDGDNGFLAGTQDEWAEKLERLINDRDLRARLGRKGQETVRTTEAYEAVIPRLARILLSL